MDVIFNPETRIRRTIVEGTFLIRPNQAEARRYIPRQDGKSGRNARRLYESLIKETSYHEESNDLSTNER